MIFQRDTIVNCILKKQAEQFLLEMNRLPWCKVEKLSRMYANCKIIHGWGTYFSIMALPEILNQNFCANYVKMFLLWAKPLSDLAKYRLNVTIHKHDCIYSQKGTAQWKYRQWFWNVFKMQEIISRIRGFAWNSDDFSQRYWKADIRKFRHGVHTEIYGVFKVKNRKKFQSGSAKCNWTWK